MELSKSWKLLGIDKKGHELHMAISYCDNGKQLCAMCLQARGTEHNPAFTMSAASAAFSRFPSIPMEALADLDAVLDWSAKPMSQRTLSSILTAEVNPPLTFRTDSTPQCALIHTLMQHTNAVQSVGSRQYFGAQPSDAASKAAAALSTTLSSSALALPLQCVSCCDVLSEYPCALRC